ncbi:glutamine synthetase family protein [Actinocorallia sp. API 0066]|uniref:glutamine synthetase family protein n=1 Tax=Actinocorallia sp. API 0066 TaxID=2896846 RepID=UPI001E55A0E7|nr:glutamine synthetase family protein [Actinocorallia sp. API 0066]MCD0452617.1 glutamine synthetase family protein [Actinocorallia sp. API 0066]
MAEKGVGVTSLFAVFDSHDGITFAHEGLATPSGDVRLVPVVERLVRLRGQDGLAWAPGRQVAADGSAWAYDQRSVLERQVAEAAERGLTFKAGWELEFVLSSDDGPAPGGPAYSSTALLSVDEFTVTLLRDLEANGLGIGQFHAEYGQAQFELSLLPSDPVSAADDQLLARQTIHAAARAHGLRAGFAPLHTAEGVGNGWHLHVSALRDGVNILPGDGPHGLSEEGGAFLAGLLRDLPAITSVTAPSVPSSARLRPGYFSSAYAFWGVENREAPLRFVPATPLLGDGHANIELKPSDASANPYLALAVVIASGLAGLKDGLVPPAPIAEDPGTWSEERRAEHGVTRLPETPRAQLDALAAAEQVGAVLGPELLGAFRAVREADLAWAAERPFDAVVEAHRWKY